MTELFPLRLALSGDVPDLEVLIPISVRTLQARLYSPAQIEAALGPVFGVSRQLITEATYFVVENAGEIIGCGGWSRRRAVYGGYAETAAEDAVTTPAHDAVRIRAFFVHPAWARLGIGRAILSVCATAAHGARFPVVPSSSSR